MKVFSAALAATPLALALVVAQDACDSNAWQAALGQFSWPCAKATGFSANNVATQPFPVGEALTKICTESSCQKLLAAMKQAVPTECLFTNGVKLKEQVLDKFTAACPNATADAAASNKNDVGTDASDFATASPTANVVPTPTPAPTTNTVSASTTATGTAAGVGAIIALAVVMMY